MKSRVQHVVLMSPGLEMIIGGVTMYNVVWCHITGTAGREKNDKKLDQVDLTLPHWRGRVFAFTSNLTTTTPIPKIMMSENEPVCLEIF